LSADSSGRRRCVAPRWSAATIATVRGFGFCAIAVSKKPLVMEGFGSGPDETMEK
jgi:hypothetical protein